MFTEHRRRPDPDHRPGGRPCRKRVRRDKSRPAVRVEPTGAIAHFGTLCRIVEQLQAEAAADDAPRHDAEHFSRLLALAARLDFRGDESGHYLRRSLCIGLQGTERVAAARSLIASVAKRPAAERVDLFHLMEHLLIVGFDDRHPMTTAECRSMHAMLATANASAF